MTIVAATDFSPCGNHAVVWACSIARPGTHVVIVNVVRHENETEKSLRALDCIKAMVSRHDRIHIDKVSTVGKDIAATICAIAERVAADS